MVVTLTDYHWGLRSQRERRGGGLGAKAVGETTHRLVETRRAWWDRARPDGGGIVPIIVPDPSSKELKRRDEKEPLGRRENEALVAAMGCWAGLGGQAGESHANDICGNELLVLFAPVHLKKPSPRPESRRTDGGPGGRASWLGGLGWGEILLTMT